MDIAKVPTHNMARLVDEINKMARKAARLGCQPVRLVEHGIETVTKKDEHGFNSTITYHLVSVEGEKPQLAGWQLLARKTPVPTDAGVEYIIKPVPGLTVPEGHRFTGMECDHCHTARRRNDVFLVQAVAGGEVKQVGRQCISDFLGGVDPEQLLGRAEMLLDARDIVADAEEYSWGGRPLTFHLPSFLALVSLVVRRLGWVSKGMALKQGGEGFGPAPTATIVWEVLTCRQDRTVQEFIRKNKLDQIEDQDNALAEAAHEWAKALGTVDVVDYLYNLGVVARSNFVDSRNLGLAASIVAAFQRQKRQAEEKAARPASKHVGNKGVRSGFPGLTVKGMNHFDGAYGVKTLVRFTDAEGNNIIWWTGEAPDWCKEEATVDLTAMVKDHAEYKGQLQTVLTRCSIGLPKEKKKKNGAA